MAELQGQLGGLLERVKLGNTRLFEAFLNSINACNEAQAEAYRVQLDKAFPRLEALCWQLEAEGHTTCLYAEPKCLQAGCGVDNGFFCWVCPAKVLPVKAELPMAVKAVPVAEPGVVEASEPGEVERLWAGIQREAVSV